MYQLIREYWDEDTDLLEFEEVLHRFPTMPSITELIKVMGQNGAYQDADACAYMIKNADSYYILMDRHFNLYGLERVLA